jgi:hypothetical protein
MTKPKNRPGSAVSPGRRGFLRHAGAVCGTLSLMAAFPAPATVSARPRRVQFVHTHTGETLAAEYFDGSGYNETCLSAVDHLLRDFRTGESHRIDPQLLDILYDLQALADRESTIACNERDAAPKFKRCGRAQSTPAWKSYRCAIDGFFDPSAGRARTLTGPWRSGVLCQLRFRTRRHRTGALLVIIARGAPHHGTRTGPPRRAVTAVARRS